MALNFKPSAEAAKEAAIEVTPTAEATAVPEVTPVVEQEFNITVAKTELQEKIINSDEIDRLTAQIDVSNPNSIVKFGAPVAEEISKASDQVLNSMDINQINDSGRLLQIIQKFDFTKDIPKIVIVSAGQNTFEAPECILLTLFNLIGFDIIVYTPTGYKNLEAYIRPEAFQEFIHGEFKYDFRPQNLAIPKEIPQEKTSFFGRIFKGRK